MNWPFAPLTELKYGALLIDFPWPYDLYSEAGYEKSPETHYRSMSERELLDLPVNLLAANDCLAWVWSTWPHIPLAMKIMRSQGFEYKTGGSWTKKTVHGKNAFGTGFILRSTTEPYLIFTLGKPRIGSKSVRNLIETEEAFDYEAIPSLIESQRREHSRKPPEARENLKLLRPECHIAELFAREPWPADGDWDHDVWGFETDKFVAQPEGSSSVVSQIPAFPNDKVTG